MQSRPSPSLQTNAPTDTLPGTLSATQHGTPLEHDSSSSIAAARVEEDVDPLNAPEEQERRGARSDAHSLHHALKASAGSSSPRNRISDYENIARARSRRSPGPVFDVIGKLGVGTINQCHILHLPNEILTHALANLSPDDLTAASLVSKRFHELVTTQHAWRAAFSRYFHGAESLNTSLDRDYADESEDGLTPRREFTRLTSFASWRSEYILRTRLLRSLGRGRPVQQPGTQLSSKSGQSHVASPTLLYNSQMLTTINHIAASFGTSLNKRVPHLIHGADDFSTATFSDPTTGKVQGWGLADPTTMIQFADRFPGDALYGLGAGEIVGVPNPMDVSEPFGMVCAEGLPDGMIYFRFAEELRGRFLAASSGITAPELGIPKVLSTRESQCSVWVAKTPSIPSLTDGMIGIISGSSLGVLTTYSLGQLSTRDQRHPRGEMTARWVVSPGVPIISIAVDEQYSYGRLGQNRIWAVILNALGEVYYLTKFPKRATGKPPNSRFDDEARERRAWQSGRTVHWTLIESTRRCARPDPYGEMAVDGSYSPRSSWDGMCLSKEQIKAESHEIEAFLKKTPVDVQARCSGWDMQQRMEVDFAGVDSNDAGEGVIVIRTGAQEGSMASVTRYTRLRVVPDVMSSDRSVTPPLTEASTIPSTQPSIFGSSSTAGPSSVATSPSIDPLNDTVESSSGSAAAFEEWRLSTVSFAQAKGFYITSSALDHSSFAVTTVQDDPLLSFTGTSVDSSPSLTPMSAHGVDVTARDVPGQRSRMLALGTSLGTVLVYNIRGGIPASSTLSSTITPVRVIYTDSPAISSLALTGLYLVHGGTDGLVQAWDPLASTTSPIRTLHSRFSSRARRRLAQAAASPHGIGINLFAAGAIALDPDPTVLRGVAGLGAHLFYWHFSSSAADAYRSHKRRLRRPSERNSSTGGGAAGERFVATPGRGGGGQGAVRSFIESERRELGWEEERERRESARMAGRFGTDLLGESATEEDLLAYAALLSQEAFASDVQRRGSTPVVVSATDGGAANAAPSSDEHVDDPDLAEAIKQSLAASSPAPAPAPALASEGASASPWQHPSAPGEHASPPPATSAWAVPFKYAKPKHRTTPKNSPRMTPAVGGGGAGGSGSGSGTGSTAVTPGVGMEKDELEFALELSRAEELSRNEAASAYNTTAGGDRSSAQHDDFPDLAGSADKKGKGRAN